MCTSQWIELSNNFIAFTTIERQFWTGFEIYYNPPNVTSDCVLGLGLKDSNTLISNS